MFYCALYLVELPLVYFALIVHISIYSIYFRDVSDQLQSRGSSDLDSPDGQKRFCGNPVRNNFTGKKYIYNESEVSSKCL